MFLPLLLLPSCVTGDGILDSLLRPLMRQFEGVRSDLAAGSPHSDRRIPGNYVTCDLLLLSQSQIFHDIQHCFTIGLQLRFKIL